MRPPSALALTRSRSGESNTDSHGPARPGLTPSESVAQWATIGGVPKGGRRGRLILIDAHSLIYRAFFALPPMSTSQGQVTNAVYGFTSMLAIVLASRPEYAIAAFDVGKPSFRSEEYAAYKQGRRPMPDDLRSQMELVRKVLESLAIPTYGVESFEADDVS